jgi:hypothetical protein
MLCLPPSPPTPSFCEARATSRNLWCVRESDAASCLSQPPKGRHLTRTGSKLSTRSSETPANRSAPPRRVRWRAGGGGEQEKKNSGSARRGNWQPSSLSFFRVRDELNSQCPVHTLEDSILHNSTLQKLLKYSRISTSVTQLP